MNWHMIISMLIVVVLKVIGMTLFLLHFSQIFGNNNNSLIPTRSYGTGHTIHTTHSPTVSSACPKDWDLHLGRCFFFSISEEHWSRSKEDCVTKDSTLAIVNTPEKLTYLQEIAGVEKYFIGLIRGAGTTEKRWHWIDNSEFNGNVTNQNQNFNCATIGLTKAFDAAPCDVSYRWICEKTP
ncbi:C-type lectin domain family 5 member A [Dipodomys spectabilis]|uniref:C-type lectin domain family 5 member A n=1 Tax=Dipodomys spectabilis TaxID=105255 RepID=UPI001C546261|nr:C-type lectin domain family 5 member A [Dipodomys spectabilis]XP_042533179.1 C-type lectin domain family 5 member A [Dipodomys spectabilis]